jgi:hypothetical protein
MAQITLMSPINRGQSVNHHFKVHIYEKSTGALVEDVIPFVTATDQEGGTFWGLAPDQAAGISQGVLTSWHVSCLNTKSYPLRGQRSPSRQHVPRRRHRR